MSDAKAKVKAVSKIHSVHHVNFPIADIPTTEAWYGKVFGMRTIDMNKEEAAREPGYITPNPQGLFMRAPDDSFDLHFNHNGKHQPVPGAVHFALEVEDWEGFLAHLEEVGVEYKLRGGVDARPGQAGVRPQDGSMTAQVRDPDGYLVELTYHPGRDW